MSVNFSELKRKEIRRTFGEGEGQIIVYNPSPEEKREIERMIAKYRKDDSENINISAEDMILDFLPLTTNIILDLDRNNKDDMEVIRQIISDPDPTFEDTISEVSDLIKEIASRYFKALNNLAQLPKEDLKKLINQFKEETPEEKELRELKERQKELENKIINKNEE